jgi:metal-responsive CopG/Arc/MetJ family transcriptional regulator
MSVKSVSIPDELIAAVNRKAAEERRNFSSVVTEVLRKEFSSSNSGQKSA